MSDLTQSLAGILADAPDRLILSKQAAKTQEYRKVIIEKKNDCYQIARYTEKQVFHENCDAGRLADWMTEAAMIGGTKLLGRNDYVVLAALKEVRIKKPMTAGMILQFEYEVAKLGTTSIDIFVLVTDMLSGDCYATGNAVFVTVDDAGKKAPHGLSLEK